MQSPITKIRNAFESIQQQLRIGQQEIQQLHQELAGQQQRIDKLEEEKQELIHALEQQRQAMRKDIDVLYQQGEAAHRNVNEVWEKLKAEQDAISQGLEHSLGKINDRFYHTDLQLLEKEMYQVDLIYPDNRKRYELLKGSQKGKTCVIVGNGPSLRMEDLELLQKKGIQTFASNRVYLAYPDTTWRPTYYLCQDFKMIDEHWEEMKQLKDGLCFFPHSIVYEYGKRTNQENVLFFPFKYRNPHPIWFSCNPDKAIHEGMTITFTSMQIAAMMGFEKIYLIGVDFNYPMVQNECGEWILDMSQQTHFSSKYYNPNEEIYQPNLKDSFDAYKSALEYGQANNLTIYNATRGGKLEVFPRVDFDEVFCNQ